MYLYIHVFFPPFLKAGMLLWTGKTSCQAGKSKGWAWLACFTTGTYVSSGNCDCTVVPKNLLGKTQGTHPQCENTLLKT